MKKMILIALMAVMTVGASAMTYSEARNEALFLTDKMAYELNLTDEQYDAAYEINLDYLLGINSRSELYGTYWTVRNTNLAYILADWQYALYKAAAYFYRPLYWSDNVWHLSVYTIYTNRNYYYRPRPTVYVTYRGGNRSSYYASRTWTKPLRRSNYSGNSRTLRTSSTRQTVNNATFGNARSRSVATQITTTTTSQRSIGTFSPSARSFGNASTQSNNTVRSFGGARSGSTSTFNTQSMSTNRNVINRSVTTAVSSQSTGRSGAFGGHR